MPSIQPFLLYAPCAFIREFTVIFAPLKFRIKQSVKDSAEFPVSVCKTCIVKYLQSSKFCPQCNIKIHETQPLMNLKPDRVMQDIVYKLVPTLFESKF